MQTVFDRIVLELEKPRPLTAQCLKYLAGTYGLGRDEVGAFLDRELTQLADDEIDLALSSLFTPKLADQAVFAELLGAQSIPESEWPRWIEQLEHRPTVGCLLTEAGTAHRSPLRAVTLERYVHRLRLEAALPDPLYRLILSLAPAADRPVLLAIARRAVWDTPERQQILQEFLARNCAADTYRRDDVEALLALMESAAPTDLNDLQTRLPEWQQVLRSQLTTAGMPRPFFNLQVEEMHGGGRDRRPADSGILDRKQAELAFLCRLEQTLFVSDPLP